MIWYGNWDGNSATDILTNFAQNLGSTPWWNINIGYQVSALTYGGSASDSYSQGTQLSGSSILSIVNGAISSGQLSSDPNGIYLVLTSGDCNEDEFCTQACGWHTYDSNSNLIYGWVGNPESLCPNSCGVRSVSPNDNPGADAMASIVAHELAEAASDPHIDAWFDASNQENGDKCAWNFGTTDTASNGADYNIVVNGYGYLIQQLWDPSSQSCLMSLS